MQAGEESQLQTTNLMLYDTTSNARASSFTASFHAAAIVSSVSYSTIALLLSLKVLGT